MIPLSISADILSDTLKKSAEIHVSPKIELSIIDDYNCHELSLKLGEINTLY